MHRFMRLWRKLPWTIQELDLVLQHLWGPNLETLIVLLIKWYGILLKSNSAAAEEFLNSAFNIIPVLKQEITVFSLDNIKTVLDLQRRFKVSVDALCGLWSELPDRRTDDKKPSFFNRCFNLPEFTTLQKKWVQGNLPKYLHPAFRETPPSEPDLNTQRLTAGLLISDSVLHQLILYLSKPLGVRLNATDVKQKEFQLTPQKLALLYRHARLAEWLKLSIPELFQLIQLVRASVIWQLDQMPENTFQSSDIPCHITNLEGLSLLLEYYDWWKATDYSLDELALITEVKNPPLENLY
jgi:hypothetical protein